MLDSKELSRIRWEECAKAKWCDNKDEKRKPLRMNKILILRGIFGKYLSDTQTILVSSKKPRWLYFSNFPATLLSISLIGRL